MQDEGFYIRVWEPRFRYWKGGGGNKSLTCGRDYKYMWLESKVLKFHKFWDENKPGRKRYLKQ